MNKQQQQSQNELTIQSVFSIKKEGSVLALTAPTIYNTGEDTTVTGLEFYMRLGKTIPNMEGFNWDGILLAGGLVSGLLEKKYNPDLYINSDLDFFVYRKAGESKSAIISRVKRVYNYFKSLFGNIVSFYYKNSMVITILTPLFDRPIQIIGTDYTNPLDVIKNFDLTHCQVGFDGHNVICTKKCMKAIKTRVTKITTNSIHAYRIVKTYKRGYSIEKPNKLYIKNIFHTYIEGAHGGMYKNTDKIWDMNKLDELIDEMMENETVKLNLNKGNYIPKEINTDTFNEITKSYSQQATILELYNNNESIYGEDFDKLFDDFLNRSLGYQLGVLK